MTNEPNPKKPEISPTPIIPFTPPLQPEIKPEPDINFPNEPMTEIIPKPNPEINPLKKASFFHIFHES
jgi:hypothetical protein